MFDSPTEYPDDASAEPGGVLTLSQPFVGRWQELVSVTNWRKGQIIQEWRTALMAAGATATDYGDEAWSSQVGGVTSQHVGRLRRVFARFGAAQHDFPGLSWSHFLAAIDWKDAEMWLEGAVHNDWSVAAMRGKRIETLGEVAANEQDENAAAAAEINDDFVPFDAPLGQAATGRTASVRNPGGEESFGPDFGDESADARASARDGNAADDFDASRNAQQHQPVRPFVGLAELPTDLAEAFEAFKLAILRHKLAGWTDVSRDDVMATLDALKELALAESS